MKKETRQKPLSEEDYKKRSKPKGAFGEIWSGEEGLPYSCHKHKIWEVVASRAIKEEIKEESQC